MKIIISPAKKMYLNTDILPWRNLPRLLPYSKTILKYLSGREEQELKQIWKCSDAIVEENRKRLLTMDLENRLSPAIFSYEGIQYQYLAPQIMTKCQLDYLEENLRILSGLYGILRPFDGVRPYRLEMQSKIPKFQTKTLYAFWNREIYDILTENDSIILNLASKEYSKVIEPYLEPGTKYVTCIFGEWVNGKLKEKGTYAKMARGEMVRFLAETQAKSLNEVKQFQGLGYRYEKILSTENEFVFVKGE